MNYECQPDIDPEIDLNVDAVGLFQRFRQDVDVKTVDTLLDQEFARHIKLCELAILHAANADIYWCELPQHPLMDFDLWARQHLEKMGFVVEFTRIATKEAVPCDEEGKKTLKTVVVRSRLVAKWFLGKPLNPELASSEWHRREALEDGDLVTNPPQRESHGTGDDIDNGAAVWAAVLDKQYVVEVQRINHRSYLCLFDLTGKCLFFEKTNVAYGAMFGRDIGDVAIWQDRATAIVDGWKSRPPPA
jgi:hypothetical protein